MIRAGARGGVPAARHGGLHGTVRGQPGAGIQLDPRRHQRGRQPARAAPQPGAGRTAGARRRWRIRSSRPSITNTVNRFDSNLQMPYTQSYTAGWQRKLGSDTAIEIRYVGSRHRQDWETMNINEANITTNGFVNEFRQAQANLQANMAAGRGATFAYTGAPGTTRAADLPRLLERSARRAGCRRVRVHRRLLVQRAVSRLPGGDEPEPVRVHVQQRAGLHDRDLEQRVPRQARCSGTTR